METKKGGGRTLLMYSCRSTEYNTDFERVIAREVSGYRNVTIEENLEDSKFLDFSYCNNCNDRVNNLIMCDNCDGEYCNEYCLKYHHHIGALKCSYCFNQKSEGSLRECSLCNKYFCKKHFEKHILDVKKNYNLILKKQIKEIKIVDSAEYEIPHRDN